VDRGSGADSILSDSSGIAVTGLVADAGASTAVSPNDVTLGGLRHRGRLGLSESDPRAVVWGEGVLRICSNR